jgi:hypothetical protein
MPLRGDDLRSYSQPATRVTHAWPVSAGAFLRLWPGAGSVATAAAVDLVIGAVRHFDFAGIEGFSTTNYGWLAFSLVGGAGLAWRLAKPPAGWWLLLRPLAAPALAFVACLVTVTLMGVLFLPGQPVTETLTTDAPGRALWLSVLVAVASCASEGLWAVIRWVRRHRQAERP